MPTGYTASVQDGKVTTLREYAIQCIRGMGVCITMRDDPADTAPPAAFEPSTEYHDRAIAEATAILAEIPELSAGECGERAKAEFDQAMADHIRYAAEQAAGERRYREMLAQVEAWKAPAEIESLRDFMRDQLKQSIEFDCGGSYKPSPPVRLTGEKWREAKLQRASKDLAYHETERAKEIDRTNARNKYLAAFWSALPAASLTALEEAANNAK